MPKRRAARHARAAVLPLLAAAAGAVDALAFIALGHVFAGVMTGNLILLAIGLGSGSPGDAAYPLVALTGFALSVVAAGRFCRTHGSARTDVTSAGEGPGGHWGRGVLVCLMAEVALLAAVGVAWADAGGHPDGAGRAALIAVLSVAMGLQTAAMFAAGPSGAPTTYFTGTLSALLTNPSGGRPAGSRLAALLAGAVGAAALRTWAPAWAALPPPVCAAGALACALSAGPHEPEPSAQSEPKPPTPKPSRPSGPEEP
ncbi:YoaK family protein [Streptomyces sp. NPDC059398]|uniref:YoaK family protein n=1 Tax=Streptomyces sp. NPDC059398 TaxID=3346820 RepID=UPI0036744221